MWTLEILFTFLISIGITFFMMPKIITFSAKKHLYDTLDGRKQHQEQISRLGGIVFVPTILICIVCYTLFFILYEGHSLPEFLTWRNILIIGAFIIIYAAGVTDDLLQIGYRVKFIAQILAAILIVSSGLYFDDLYGFFGIEEIVPAIGMPLTALLIMTCINAYNLIDGIDGLCSGIAIISLAFLACLFPSQDIDIFILLTISTLGTLMVFFCFNVFGKAEKGRKIFMGDCGSQTIGLLLSVLAIHYCTQEAYTSGIPTENKAVAICISLLMVPVFDVVRIIIHRLREHKNPFLPDRNHIHHKFLALGMGQRSALMAILGITLFFILFNLSLQKVFSITILLILDIALYTLLNIVLTIFIKKRATK